MILQGIVSNIKEDSYKVFIKEKNFLSNWLQKCLDVRDISIGDIVVVAFYDATLSQGVVIGVLETTGGD